jgi:hypothetical protein
MGPPSSLKLDPIHYVSTVIQRGGAVSCARLVPGLARACRVDERAVVGGELAEGPVDERVVEVGLDDAGLQVVRLLLPAPLCGRDDGRLPVAAVNGRSVAVSAT